MSTSLTLPALRTNITASEAPILSMHHYTTSLCRITIEALQYSSFDECHLAVHLGRHCAERNPVPDLGKTIVMGLCGCVLELRALSRQTLTIQCSVRQGRAPLYCLKAPCIGSHARAGLHYYRRQLHPPMIRRCSLAYVYCNPPVFEVP